MFEPRRQLPPRATTPIPRPVRLAICWALACVGAMSFAANARAATVTFSWTANPEPDLAGYKLYYGIEPGPPYEATHANEGISPVDIPLAALADPDNPEFSLTGLPSCEHFYFALTAYDTEQLESDYSEQVDTTVIAPPDPVTATPAASGELLLEWEAPPWDDLGSIPLYRIYFDTDSGEPYEAPGSPFDVPASSLDDEWDPDLTLSGLTNGTTYYIVIESECGDGTTTTSEEATGTPSEQGSGGTGGAGTGAGGTGATGTGTGTSTGTGGTGLAGTGAGSSAGGAALDGDGADADSGCACRMGSRDHGRRAFGLLALAFGLAARRRRREQRAL